MSARSRYGKKIVPKKPKSQNIDDDDAQVDVTVQEGIKRGIVPDIEDEDDAVRKKRTVDSKRSSNISNRDTGISNDIGREQITAPERTLETPERTLRETSRTSSGTSKTPSRDNEDIRVIQESSRRNLPPFSLVSDDEDGDMELL
jgi:hypothetical protein